MKSFAEMDYHPDSEQLVEILCNKTQNTNPLFFRIQVAYYLSVVAAMMRCQINTLDRGKIPVNFYGINLSPSGSGKGHSSNVLEEEVVGAFFHTFEEQTFPLLAERNLPNIAQDRALRRSTDPSDELERARKEFEGQGPLLLSFDSGTSPAVKQARHKLLMANAGALNFQMDEIGSNLVGNTELLNTYLELFDIGKVKQKLVKNTAENSRTETIHGRTPTNMMLFGAPVRLLNGSKTEEEFYAMLDTGYARRCFFGFAQGHNRDTTLTATEVLQRRMCNNTSTFLQDFSDRLEKLADMLHVNKELQVSEEVTLLFIEYQLACERLAEELPEHEEMKKAELSHRYFKALKLAGTYAFIEGSPEITEEHAYYALKLAEESGQAFTRMLTRDRPYVKLAKYISDIGRNVTQADLVEDLPFYRGSAAQKQEMMQLATAYGYQNNIIIKKAYNEGIEFLRGETLEATDPSKLIVSYSTDIAKNYKDDYAPFTELEKLTQAKGLHWVNHHLKDGHRNEENALPGFNLVVIDVDKGVDLEIAKSLLKDYKALFYTTKRHTAQDHRFRIIMPTNYILRLDASDYKDFMNNLFEWLPFEVDSATNQRARKWLSHNDHFEYQDGILLDVLPFIPKTSKNDMRKQRLNDQRSLDNLERWVINNTGDGNRNNQLLRYALILVDAGFGFDAIHGKVTELNNKLPDKLEEAEILSTIMKTVSKALASK